MLDSHFTLWRIGGESWKEGVWKGRSESEISRYVPVEDIIASEYNLDLCGFPHETVEILPPGENLSPST